MYVFVFKCLNTLTNVFDTNKRVLSVFGWILVCRGKALFFGFFVGRVGGSNAKSNYSFLIEIFISFSARP